MGDFLSYTDQTTAAMTWLARDQRTLFVGQSVQYDGQALFNTFSCVPLERRIEMPVAEDFQMGFCIGLAMEGYIPISFYPRMDFLLLALNQMVNHADKIQAWHPHLIIRTAVGAVRPLNPGPQHTQDHTEAFGKMVTTIKIVKLTDADSVLPAYKTALETPGVWLIIEYMEKHNGTS